MGLKCPTTSMDFQLICCYTHVAIPTAIRRFLLFFFIHIVWLYFGILSYPLMMLIFNKNERANLQFLKLDSLNGPLHIVSIFNISLFVLYCICGEEYMLPRTVIAVNILVVTRRAFIIAVRYATTNPLKQREFKERVFTQRESSTEFVLPGWINCDQEQIDLHVHHSMVRLQIENIGFFYRNVNSICPKVCHKL